MIRWKEKKKGSNERVGTDTGDEGGCERMMLRAVGKSDNRRKEENRRKEGKKKSKGEKKKERTETRKVKRDRMKIQEKKEAVRYRC